MTNNLQKRKEQLEFSLNNINKIRDEMMENNFLFENVDKGKTLKFQEEINKNEFSNYFHINKVFESLKNLKTQGNLTILNDEEIKNNKNGKENHEIEMENQENVSEPIIEEKPEIKFKVS